MANNTYVALSTQTVSSAVSSVTFSSIPQGYTDLVLVGSFSQNSNVNLITVRVGNGSVDTTSNYSMTYLLGNGSSASSGRYSNQTFGFLTRNLGGTTTVNGSSIIAHFQNYSNTTTHKTIINRANQNNSSFPGVEANVNLWRSTSAINVIQLGTTDGNIEVGSTFTIYGISKTIVSPTDNPPVTAGLYRRFDASNLSSVISSGGRVSQWNSLVNSGTSVAQANSTYQPYTGVRTQNGLNTLTATAHFLMGDVSITSNALTYFFVGNKVGSGNGSNVYSRYMSIWKNGGTDYDNNNSIIGVYSDQTIGGYNPANYVYRGGAVAASNSENYNNANVSVIRLNGTAITMYQNGVATTGTTSASTLNSDKITLFGSANGNLDSYLNGWIGEVLVYNTALSDSDVTSVSNWLKSKWNTV